MYDSRAKIRFIYDVILIKWYHHVLLTSEMGTSQVINKGLLFHYVLWRCKEIQWNNYVYTFNCFSYPFSHETLRRKDVRNGALSHISAKETVQLGLWATKSRIYLCGFSDFRLCESCSNIQIRKRKLLYLIASSPMVSLIAIFWRIPNPNRNKRKTIEEN